MRTTRAAAWIVAAALAACSDPPPPVAVRKEPPPVARAEPPAPPKLDARLRTDVGGWVPPAALLDVVEGMGDPARKPAALTALDAMSDADRIDALRAGLRLADTAAAIACAARLNYKHIDGWECARCVDLLKSEVLRKGTEADFDEFRSYLGTADLGAFIDALPPRPWNVKVDRVFGELHRILQEDALDVWAKAMRHPTDSDIANAAVGEWSGMVLPRCDRRREETYRLFQPFGTVIPQLEGPGLPPELVVELKADYLYDLRPDPEDNPLPQNVDMSPWTSRWMLDSTPGPRDEAMLVEIAERCGSTLPGRNATILLGRMRGELSDAFLSEEARDGDEDFSWVAIAMRHGAGGVDRLVAWIDAGSRRSGIAALMEADPARARKELERRMLGADEEAALSVLEELQRFLPPGKEDWDARPFLFRRTSWDGFAEKAAATPMSALRRAWLGVAVPVCHTRATAEAACRDLDASCLVTKHREEADAFLEAGAPDAFRAALRRIAREEKDDAREEAIDALLTIGDAAAGALLVAERWGRPELLPRSACPEVVTFLTKAVRDGKADAACLASALGAPDELEWPDAVPAAATEALLAGDWLGAFHVCLTTTPDEKHYGAGAVRDDPVVRDYLQSLRTRRALGEYWWATGQLAAMGDPAARDEFWRAMRDGRYRLREGVGLFAMTLGNDIAATWPFWIDELRGSCCKVAMNPCDRLLEVHDSETAWLRVRAIWDAAGGADGLVWSRVGERYVIAPR